MSINELLSSYGTQYLQAALTTWRLTALAFLFGSLIGMLITVLRVCPIGPLRIFAELYIQIFRNIPGAALLIFLVYALPYLALLLPYGTCVLMATVLIVAAFFSEYLMSGMNTVAAGQIEAARALGLKFLQIIIHIVLPQAFRASVPQMTNLLIATMLTTALASQVPMRPTDLTGIVSHINTHAVGGVTAFVISAAIYILTALVIGWAGKVIDRKVRIQK